jgi:hypothetical protein
MPRKDRNEYNEYMRKYMRNYRANKRGDGNMSSGWKTRKRGTPAQRGTRFRTDGMSLYRPPTPVGVRFYGPANEESKVVSHRNVSDAAIAYVQLMALDPAFRSKSLFERLDVLQEAFSLSSEIGLLPLFIPLILRQKPFLRTTPPSSKNILIMLILPL